MELNKIYHGHCLEVLKTLPSETVEREGGFMNKCECGSTEFRCYFHHISKGIKRFRCLKCNNRYELQEGSRLRLELPSLDIDEQAWQNLREKLYII